ncbi:MAG: NADP-dependent oxidoreductase, partial [Pseudomonadota bacterium]
MAQSLPDTYKVWRLKRRPQGIIQDGDLELDEVPMPPLQDGEVRVQTLYLSLDPTDRIWMSDRKQYMPPVPLDQPMRGPIVGRVVESRQPGLQPGDNVEGTPQIELGHWADYLVGKEGDFRLVPRHNELPLADYFGQMAIVAPTAYIGLMEIATPKAGETLVVSTAAGAVGSIVGQIGKILGCRTVGIAGSDEKCQWVTDELGLDACLNYKTDNLEARLEAACPDGIDVYFDNVGGPILDTVLGQMNNFGRIAQCGTISDYNAATPPPGPTNYPLILMRRLTIRG